MNNFIDRFFLKFFGGLDWISKQIDKLFAPRCKCKNKKEKK
tara:strand:+ start:734 stop:856 length:123 start_codon:yes stop_codon:yes gene_type:complete